MAWKRTATLILIVVAAGALAACGSSGGSGSGGGTNLEAALARVADTSSTRSLITYDDTSALVKLAGNIYATTGYARLIGNGDNALIPYAPTLQSQSGINVLGEQYGISAGQPPAAIGLVAGNQNAAQITRKLTGQGWKKQGQRLVMLPLNLNNPLDGALAGWLSQVQATGSDVLYGQPQANLSLVGAPSGQTLEQDPLISALANCLGDVVAADITSDYPLSTLKPTEVAIGITRPASNSAVPHAVVCVSWPTSATAGQYAAALRQAFSSGSSRQLNEQWSAILHAVSVTTIGGSQNVVQWQGQTPKNVLTIFDMFESLGLPALEGKV